MNIDPRVQLRRTFGPFLGRFGRLNAVQEAAAPLLLDGKSAVIAAPTASGKTEAAIVPLIERWVPADCTSLKLLYVVPTRALVNDLVRRLEGPLDLLRITLVAKTGDIPTFKAKEQPAVLITTPESLDSLLCRRRGLFDQLACIVLDEVHLIDGTARGDQLQVLLRRLPDVQRVVLSATVADPQRLVERYAGHGAVIVHTGEARPIDLELVKDEKEVIDRLRAAGRIKALWFCNTRAAVEQVSAGLATIWPPDRIVAHHGSLERSNRRESEAALRDWTWGICVATMTLEVGVDIGDVDAVVLDGPPRTVSAFVQRVGRGSRREGRVTAIGLCREEDDEQAFELLASLASEGRIEPIETRPDPSVAVQQILSLVYGAPKGVSRDGLGAIMEPVVDSVALSMVLTHLEEKGYIELGRGLVRATTKTMDMGEKGRIHSNIANVAEKVLKDARTGKAIGSSLMQVEIGQLVVIGGRTRKVVGVDAGSVSLAAAEGPAGKTSFAQRRRGGAFSWLLPDVLRT